MESKKKWYKWTYKPERDSQALRMNLWLPREGVAGQDGRIVRGCLLFNISCSNRYAVVAHCGLHLCFSSGWLCNSFPFCSRVGCDNLDPSLYFLNVRSKRKLTAPSHRLSWKSGFLGSCLGSLASLVFWSSYLAIGSFFIVLSGSRKVIVYRLVCFFQERVFFFFFSFLLFSHRWANNLCWYFTSLWGKFSSIPSFLGPHVPKYVLLGSWDEETSGSDSGWVFSVFGGLRCQGRLPRPQALSVLGIVSSFYL